MKHLKEYKIFESKITKYVLFTSDYYKSNNSTIMNKAKRTVNEFLLNNVGKIIESNIKDNDILRLVEFSNIPNDLKIYFIGKNQNKLSVNLEYIEYIIGDSPEDVLKQKKTKEFNL